MIVLDTNVVSEMMRAEPNPSVEAWINAAGPLHTTAITLGEINGGIARLPTGRRRNQLAKAASEIFDKFEKSILGFDVDAAKAYGEIVANRESRGLPISTADAQIAAICRCRTAALATRNIDDFTSTGIDLIDPWTAL